MFKFRVFITAFLLLAALFSVQSNAVQVTQNLNPAASSHILFTDAIEALLKVMNNISEMARKSIKWNPNYPA